MYGNINNMFCMVEDGIIYQVDTYNKIAIGYTNEAYGELSETTQQYYDKLVEVGVIVPPKTQEEINKEVMNELIESRKANQELLELLKKLKTKEGTVNESTNNRKRKADVSEQ